MSREIPLWLTVTVRNGRLSRSVRFMIPTEAHPWALFNFQDGIHRMNEVEFARRMSDVQIPVAAKRSGPVRTGLDDADAIHQSAMPLGMGLERLDDEPLIGVAGPDLFPAHLSPRLRPDRQLSNFRNSSTSVDEKAMNIVSDEMITSNFRPAVTSLTLFRFRDWLGLAKVDVEGSSPFSRSINCKPDAYLRAGLFSFSAILINSPRLMRRRLIFLTFGDAKLVLTRLRQ